MKGKSSGAFRPPDLSGRFDEPRLGGVPEVLCENPDGDFRRNVERMKRAEQAMTEFVATERLKRAKHTRSHKLEILAPGDLVFVWRVQVPAARGPAAASRRGGFTGPCRVLATETKLTDEGNYRPGSVAWLIRGSRLIKACPAQLRRASVREEYMEEITNPPDLPWTMTKLTEDLGAHQFDDLTDQAPDPMKFRQACEEEQAPPVRRARQKRAVPECPRPSREVSGLEESDQFGHLVLEELQEGFQDHYAACFWSSSGSGDSFAGGHQGETTHGK